MSKGSNKKSEGIDCLPDPENDSNEKKSLKRLTDSRIRHNDHNVSVRGKSVDEASEIHIPNFHAVKLSG